MKGGERERESHKKLKGYIFPFYETVDHLFLIPVLCCSSTSHNIQHGEYVYKLHQSPESS